MEKEAARKLVDPWIQALEKAQVPALQSRGALLAADQAMYRQLSEAMPEVDHAGVVWQGGEPLLVAFDGRALLILRCRIDEAAPAARRVARISVRRIPLKRDALAFEVETTFRGATGSGERTAQWSFDVGEEEPLVITGDVWESGEETAEQQLASAIAEYGGFDPAPLETFVLRAY